MLAGNSFYLVVAPKLLKEIDFRTHFLNCYRRQSWKHKLCLSYFLFSLATSTCSSNPKKKQLSARMVVKQSQLLLTFLLLCQSRLAKICMSTTLVSLETRQASYKSSLQEWPYFFPNSTLHGRHIRAHFRLCDNSFLLLQMVFTRLFLLKIHYMSNAVTTKAGDGISLWDLSC